MIFDYLTLKVIWWFFISSLFIWFFLFGGRDFGACILLPFLGKTDEERRLIINSIGPTWEGNQVWFVTAGGATFAAWPMVYATAFSGLYYALILVLFTLILRPPGFDYRSKLPNTVWRKTWDGCLFLSGFVPSLVFGVGLGNLLLGLPFHFDDTLRSHYEGTFFQLLNPFAVLVGLAAVMIMTLHGGTYLQKKLPNEMAQRAKKYNVLMGIGFITLFLLLGIWVAWGVNGYQIQSIADLQGNLIPTAKEVVVVPRAWLSNYEKYHWLWVCPIVTVLAVIFAMISSAKHLTSTAIVMSCAAIIGALLTANAAMFPFILPSSTQPNHSLTLWDSVSSHLTLQHMFWVAIIFLPVVLGYTAWVFRVMRGKLDKNEILGKVESY